MENGAGINLLDPINAFSMFANKTDITPWSYKIFNLDFEVVKWFKLFLLSEKIDKEISPRNWMKNYSKNKDILPIIIVDEKGPKRPFHYTIRPRKVSFT